MKMKKKINLNPSQKELIEEVLKDHAPELVERQKVMMLVKLLKDVTEGTNEVAIKEFGLGITDKSFKIEETLKVHCKIEMDRLQIPDDENITKELLKDLKKLMAVHGL